MPCQKLKDQVVAEHQTWESLDAIMKSKKTVKILARSEGGDGRIIFMYDMKDKKMFSRSTSFSFGERHDNGA